MNKNDNNDNHNDNNNGNDNNDHNRNNVEEQFKYETRFHASSIFTQMLIILRDGSSDRVLTEDAILPRKNKSQHNKTFKGDWR